VTNEHNDGRDPLARDTEKLLSRTEPLVPMPEPVRTSIRARLRKLGREAAADPPAGDRPWRGSLVGRILRWAPVAVALVLLVALWLGDLQGGITWADVVERLGSVRTVAASTETEVTSAAGTSVLHRARIYFKDPGLSRTEILSTAREVAEPTSVVIIQRGSDRAEQLTLLPAARQANQVTHTFRFPDAAEPSRPVLDMVSESWQRLSGVDATATRRSGEREIDGLPAVGFEMPVRELFDQLAPPMSAGTLRVWASIDTAAPVLVEIEFEGARDALVRTRLAEIEWDLPLDDDLFSLTVPDGWEHRRTRREVVEYATASLAGHITLRIGPEGRKPIISELDVIGIRRTERIEPADPGIPPSVRMTLELTPPAAERLRSFAARSPQELLIANFNDETRVVLALGPGPVAQVAIDLSRLDRTPAQIEDEYLSITADPSGADADDPR